MNISVKLIGLFQTGRFKLENRNYPDGTNIQDVVIDLDLPLQHFGIVLVNGVHAVSDTILAEGDQLVIMPIVDGG